MTGFYDPTDPTGGGGVTIRLSVSLCARELQWCGGNYTDNTVLIACECAQVPLS